MRYAHPRFALYAFVAAVMLSVANISWTQLGSAVRPAEVSDKVGDARAAGTARLRVFGFQIYDARLWALAEFNASNYSASAFALEISYLRNFDNDAVADRSIKEMRKLGSMSEAQAAQWQTQMRKIFPDIAKGDKIVGIHTPGVGASFTFNGKPAGEIKDPEFARLFFGIWLSPQTSEPQMRRELLGLPGTTP